MEPSRRTREKVSIGGQTDEERHRLNEFARQQLSINGAGLSMDDRFADVARDDESRQAAEFVPARFYAELGLPTANVQLLTDAAASVRQEYRQCSKWKRLRCRKVSIFAERDRGTVCVIQVGGSVEFDWTWEGAVAFRPRSLDDNPMFSDHSYENAAYEDEMVWTGEVLEVDERNGCLFISLDDPVSMPTTGSFFVRPFEFLSVIDSLYDCVH